VSSVISALDRHFFAPARLSDLALFRIACVLGMFFNYPSLASEMMYTEADSSLFVPLRVTKVLLAPLGWEARPEPQFLHAVWIGTIVVGVMALIGLYTRPSLLLFAAGSTLLVSHFYAFGEVHHPEAVLLIALWLLAVAPSGAALSLDALILRLRNVRYAGHFERRGATAVESSLAGWPLRTVQWLIVMVYLSAGMSKLKTGGLDWVNGYTLVYYFAIDGLRWGSSLAAPLARQPEIASVLSIGALVLELTFVLAIFVPLAAPLYLLGGIAMHGIIYAIQRAPFFQYYFLYVAFIAIVRKSAGSLPVRQRAAVGRWTVIYDGLCAKCLGTMTLLDAFDLRRRLEYLDFETDRAALTRKAPAISIDDARAAMHVVAPNGQVYRGFFAFRALARVVPLLWPILPLLYLPLAGTIGSRVYERLARTRCRRESGSLSCAV
jgi:predicted DCC family thiol-disulfide oxidoreductase YuxK